jgi:hypothetical protein
MDIKKSIEVTVCVCDICKKPTTRRNWNFSPYRFCKNHKWIEEVLSIVRRENAGVDDMVRYLREKLGPEKHEN